MCKLIPELRGRAGRGAAPTRSRTRSSRRRFSACKPSWTATRCSLRLAAVGVGSLLKQGAQARSRLQHISRNADAHALLQPCAACVRADAAALHCTQAAWGARPAHRCGAAGPVHAGLSVRMPAEDRLWGLRQGQAPLRWRAGARGVRVPDHAGASRAAAQLLGAPRSPMASATRLPCGCAEAAAAAAAYRAEGCSAQLLLTPPTAWPNLACLSKPLRSCSRGH